MDNIADIISLIIPLVIAITFHEAAHGFVANKLGDTTAKQLGRVTLNPFKHVDRVGTIILPGMLWLSGAPVLFGYAKPVPVNFLNLRQQRRDTILVALAGPAMNLLLAFLSALLLHLEAFVTPEQAPWLYLTIYKSVLVNVVLATLNMLPILPLDGGRVLGALLPVPLARQYARSERLGMILVLLLFMSPILLKTIHLPDINPSYYLIAVPADALRTLILHLAGIGNSGLSG